MITRGALIAAVADGPLELEGLRSTFVDVEGCALFALVAEGGSPTVVLQAGLGDDLGIWGPVTHSVASFARVLAYDRAGLGRSEASRQARTPRRIAAELHTLLRGLDLSPPFVLVGHSIGAHHVRAFATAHPDEVAGVVLIDPSHEEQGVRTRELFPERSRAELERADAYFLTREPGVQAEWAATRTTLESGRQEGVGPLPDVPTILLTATHLDPAADPAAERVSRTAEGTALWIRLHEELIAGLSDAVHVVRERAGHYLQREDPELVVAAIREVHAAVREGRALSPPGPRHRFTGGIR